VRLIVFFFIRIGYDAGPLNVKHISANFLDLIFVC